MTFTTPCLTCSADDPISGAAHGCPACQAVVALAEEARKADALEPGDRRNQVGRRIGRLLSIISDDLLKGMAEKIDREALGEPSQDDLDALEDGIGTRPKQMIRHTNGEVSFVVIERADK